jgi:hypothetical protein
MRTGAHFLYVSAGKIIKNGVVERNAEGVVTNIFSLDDHRIETEQTIFYSGTIAAMDLAPIEIGKKAELVLIDNAGKHITKI